MHTWAASMLDRSRVAKPRASIRRIKPANSSSALMPMENRMCATLPAEYLLRNPARASDKKAC
jgi:hypothetical protein